VETDERKDPPAPTAGADDRAAVGVNEPKAVEADARALRSELAIINAVQEGLAAEIDMQAMYEFVGDKLRGEACSCPVTLSRLRVFRRGSSRQVVCCCLLYHFPALA
jgi:hypothetical protein